MWGFRLSSNIWLCSVAVITPDSDIRTFRQPRFESGHDLIFAFLHTLKPFRVCYVSQVYGADFIRWSRHEERIYIQAKLSRDCRKLLWMPNPTYPHYVLLRGMRALLIFWPFIMMPYNISGVPSKRVREIRS